MTRVVNVGDRVRVGDVIARLDPQRSAAAGRERRGGARRGDLEPVAGRGRPAALCHAEGARLRRRSPISTASRRRTTKPKAGSRARGARSTSPAISLPMPSSRADADGVITATLAEPGQVVAIGQAVARLAHQRREGSRRRAAGNLARRGAAGEGDRAAVVGWRPQLPGAAARALAAGRSRDPHLRGALHDPRRRRHRRVRHDRDRDARARARDAGGARCRWPRCSIAAPGRRSMWSTTTARWRRAR